MQRVSSKIDQLSLLESTTNVFGIHKCQSVHSTGVYSFCSAEEILKYLNVLESTSYAFAIKLDASCLFENYVTVLPDSTLLPVKREMFLCYSRIYLHFVSLK